MAFFDGHFFPIAWLPVRIKHSPIIFDLHIILYRIRIYFIIKLENLVACIIDQALVARSAYILQIFILELFYFLSICVIQSAADGSDIDEFVVELS